MRANKARIAIYLSLAIGLAACGGGGGGGGGDDDDPQQPPSGFGDFDGSYTLYGTNPAGSSFATTFDDTFDADFVDGVATTNGVRTEFDFPLGNSDSGCFFRRGSVDSCAEQADGRVLALCNAPSADEPAIVGISEGRDAVFNVSSLAELRSEASARGTSGLRLRALTCANTLDAGNTVTVFADGRVLQVSGGQSGEIPLQTATQLFSASGRAVGNPASAQVGARAFKHVAGGNTTYYVVNFGASASGGGFTPFVFVSEN